MLHQEQNTHFVVLTKSYSLSESQFYNKNCERKKNIVWKVSCFNLNLNWSLTQKPLGKESGVEESPLKAFKSNLKCKDLLLAMDSWSNDILAKISSNWLVERNLRDNALITLLLKALLATVLLLLVRNVPNAIKCTRVQSKSVSLVCLFLVF